MKNVGEILRAEREKQKLAIKDVEKAISIRTHYLNAIEEGNFDVVPGEVFLKGFIRNYAEFLGLNGPELVEIYRQNRPSPSIVSITAQIPDIVAKNPVINNAGAKTVDKFSKIMTKQTSKSSSKLPWVLIGATIFLVGFGGCTIWYLMSPPDIIPQKPSETTQSSSNGPTNSILGNNNTALPTKPVAVSASFTDDCWVVVLVDGKNIYEGIPKLGNTISWEADRSIVLKLGNAGGVDITHNGKNLGKAGRSGEVLEKVFTPLAVKTNI